MEKEHQEILTKMLGLERPYSSEIEPAPWAEIYEAIGKLKERANQPPVEKWINCPAPTPLNVPHPNLHYHNGSPCYNNPCIWAGS
jgi:hypothetical protein